MIDWQPHLTPLEILERGAFGMGYFHKATYADLQGLGLPAGVIRANSRRPVHSRNAYGVKSGLSLAEWQQRGWIFDEDPLGWFHWYCRYHAGRRHPRDAHQIARQQRYLALTTRFGEIFHRPAVLQSLIHWAYDPARLLAESGG